MFPFQQANLIVHLRICALVRAHLPMHVWHMFEMPCDGRAASHAFRISVFPKPWWTRGGGGGGGWEAGLRMGEGMEIEQWAYIADGSGWFPRRCVCVMRVYETGFAWVHTWKEESLFITPCFASLSPFPPHLSSQVIIYPEQGQTVPLRSTCTWGRTALILHLHSANEPVLNSTGAFPYYYVHNCLCASLWWCDATRHIFNPHVLFGRHQGLFNSLKNILNIFKYQVDTSWLFLSYENWS